MFPKPQLKPAAGFLSLLLTAGLATMAIASSPQETPRPTPTPQQTAPAINWINLRQASAAPLNANIYVRATLVSIAEPRPESRQPYSVYLMDDTGTMRAVIFQDTWGRMSDTTFLRPGTRLDIFAQAGEYRGERQLTIAQPNHIRRTPGSGSSAMFATGDSQSYTPMSVGAINLMSVGQAVSVSGITVKYESSDSDRLPFRVELQDPTGTIEIVYWAPIDNLLTPTTRPVIGQPLHVGGVVTEFRGRLQLRVDDASRVSRRPFTTETAQNSPEERPSEDVAKE